MGYKIPDLKEDIKDDIREWVLDQYWNQGEFVDFFDSINAPDPLVDQINAIVDKHFERKSDNGTH